MYPPERSLVKRLSDKPFAIIGVNSDEDREALKEAVKKEEITWRSFWDRTTDGPIATGWNVQGWPTVHLIDAKGVIRHKDINPEKIDEALETLLKELEKPAGDKK